MITYGICGGENTGSFAHFNDLASSFLHSLNEIVSKPRIFLNQFFIDVFSINFHWTHIRILSGAVIPPNNHILQFIDSDTHSLGEKAHRSVLVQTGQTGEILAFEVGTLLLQ